MKEYKKQYYERNEKDIKAKAQERLTCECGSEICRGAYKHHLKSQCHQNYE